MVVVVMTVLASVFSVLVMVVVTVVMVNGRWCGVKQGMYASHPFCIARFWCFCCVGVVLAWV